MQFKHQLSGKVFTVVALELDNGRCPAIAYLRGLKLQDETLHVSMHSRIKFRADNLNVSNRTWSRTLQGRRYRGLHRLIVKGERLVYCFIPEGTVVLLDGYNKNDHEPSAWERTRRYKIELEAQLAQGSIEL